MKKAVFEMRMTPYRWVMSLWTNQAAMCAAAKKMDAGTSGVCNCSGRTIALPDHAHVFVGVFDGAGDTLVHELTHVVMRLFEEIGMPLNGDTTEAAAYLMGHLYQTCTDALASTISNRARRPPGTRSAYRSTL